MRFFAFLFLAAFLVSGLIRYSRAEAPPANPAQQAPAPQRPPAAPAPLAMAAAPQQGAQQGPLAAPAQAQPAPQVLRHKRRFAKAALRAAQKTPGREPPLPPRRMAKLAKPAPR